MTNTSKQKNIDFFDEAADGVTFIEGGVTRPIGVSASALHAGFRKKSDKFDFALVSVLKGSCAAAVFTTNKFCAAPVQVSKQHVESGQARGVVLNSGIANAATGDIGLKNARVSAQLVSEKLGCSPEDILVASTGVIGVQLDMQIFENNVGKLVDNLGSNDGTDIASGLAAADAIMTTDTVPKQAAVEFGVIGADGGKTTYHIGGMAKGSGMIEPNMATMLSVLTTDCALDKDAAKLALKHAVDISFNCVTVDSDTSTNDSVFLIATGGSNQNIIKANTPEFLQFEAALKTLCVSLAKQMAADGEGATKLVTVKVCGAKDDNDAYIAAKSVANSPLVKTAIAGHDANWGRLAAALGKSNAAFRQEDVSISLMGLKVCEGGLPVEFDEDEALSLFEANDNILVEADLGFGDGASRVWTCDFTHGYISINADYRS